MLETDERPRPAIVRWQLPLHAVLLVAPLAFAVSTVPGVRPDDGYSFLLDGLLNNLAYGSAAVLCLVRSLTSPARRRTRFLLASALAVYGSGNVFWTVFVRPMPDQPYPSGADVG